MMWGVLNWTATRMLSDERLTRMDWWNYSSLVICPFAQLIAIFPARHVIPAAKKIQKCGKQYLIAYGGQEI